MTTGSSFVQRALGGHAAIGLLTATLLYIVALSGTLIVIHDRWQIWEEPDAPVTTTLSPHAAQAAIDASLAAAKKPLTELYIRFPGNGFPRATITTDSGTRYLDSEGRLGADATPAWTELLIDLHESLELPAAIGLIVVGILGVFLAAASVTGVLAHPRILRDAFRLRTRHDPQLARADWHNRLGVWTLPFALAIALTGAFLGLSGVGAGVLARAYTGGDIFKVYAPIFGTAPKADAARAAAPDIVAAMRGLADRAPGVTPTYLFVNAPGTRGQGVQITAAHSRRLIYGESYWFDAAGTWLGPVGMANGSLGQQAAASTYNLHFGNFGGPVIELAYIALGLALCAITATGVTLWVRKRQRRGLSGRRFAACWEFVVWGTPAVLVGLLWTRALAGPGAPLGALFWAAFGPGIAVTLAMPTWVAYLRRALAIAIVATAILHVVVLRPGQVDTLIIDICGILLGVAMLWLSRRRVGQPAAYG